MLPLARAAAQEYSATKAAPLLSNEPFGAMAATPLGVTRIAPEGAITRREAVPQVRTGRVEQLFRRIGALGNGTPLTRIRIGVPDAGGTAAPADTSPEAQIVRRGATSTRGAALQFQFSGFSAAQTSQFQAFLQTAYPLMVQLYGEPAPVQQGRTVKVQFDATAGDGIYNLPAETAPPTDGGTILYQPLSTDDKYSRDTNNYNLTRLMLLAFHGPYIFNFNAWELGFADAAALVVNYQAQGSPADFNPALLGTYVLPVYDFFNRPELGNPFFFAENTSINLGFYRAAMSQAAWLKVYVENPNFFKSFNAQYYARYDDTSGVPLAGNTPALKNIAAAIVPTVEGLAFNDWYRRQYVLDTSITTGEKLWTGILPLANLTSGDTRSVFLGVAQHYRTDANGDETPLAGTGTVRAFNEDGAEVTNNSAELSADNRLIFDKFGEAEINSQNASGQGTGVVGFRNIGAPPLLPEQARITILLQVANAQTTAYFPYNVAGTESAPAGFYGATLGANAGTMQVQVIGGSTGNATLARGAFQAPLSYPSGPRVRTNFVITPGAGAATRTVRRNSAWAYASGRSQSLGVLLEIAPGSAPFNLNLTTSGDNRLRMFSLPLTPVESDEAAVLGVAPSSLLLARYRPNLSPQTFSRNGITYGVTADKHELYPNISQPFGPGRGYWLKVNAPINRNVQGGEPARSQPYEVPLLGGWNQIGTPFNAPFEIGAIKVRLADGAPVSFATAVNNRWVSPGIWRWKPEGGYARVDTGAASAQVLQPFEGYYIFSPQERGVKLVFDANSRAAALSARGAASADNWRLALSVDDGSTRDEDNSFGVTPLTNLGPQQPPAAKPPAATRALTLSFHSGGTPQADSTRAGRESGWADSLVAPFEEEQSWTFQVDGARAGQLVHLRWDDVNSLPQKLTCTLVDELSGKRIPMNDTREWSFLANGQPQQFRIEAKVAEPASAIEYFKYYAFQESRLAVFTAAFRAPGRAGLRIETPDGETVRTLAAGQPVDAGRYLWNWDSVDAGGRALRGSFIARLTFVTQDGKTETRTLAVVLK